MNEMRNSFAPLGIGFPAPPAIYLGAILMGTAPELVLKSRKVISKILINNKYDFEFSQIKTAINSLNKMVNFLAG